ncbi:MAG: PTS sugar transporter subunit IIC [Clostridia bacterium]|nr:PTS sugar transporter subunit IIC [Clostridia bacterium]
MEENIKNNGEAKEKRTFKDTVKKLSKRWFIDAFSGMAQGLFVTLIAGTIFKQIGTLIGADTGVGSVIILLGNIASMLMGAGIGVGIAKYLKAPNLVLFGCAVAGIVGAYLPDIAYKAMVSGTFTLSGMTDAVLAIKFGVPGNPIGAYVATLFALELTMLIYGKTKLDIIVVPLSILIISFANIFLAIPAIWLVAVIGKFIEISTAIVPFIMGIVIAVTMGILLTMPTSSAAIWISLAAGSTSDVMLLAGGAAVVGCACQMVGFAVMSFRENRWGGLISQGLGTSMLQIPNIMKNPKIFLPPIIASAICGPMATTLFQLRCNASGGGMGTSGLVGVFGVIDASTGVIPSWQMWLGIALLMFILPALISWGVSLLLRKYGWIKENDLKLEL